MAPFHILVAMVTAKKYREKLIAAASKPIEKLLDSAQKSLWKSRGYSEKQIATAQQLGIKPKYINRDGSVGDFTGRQGTGPRIVAQDGDVFEYSMTGRNRSNITVITDQTRDGNRLILSDLHIDGAGAGTSSIRELRQFARDLGRQHGVDQVVIKGGKKNHRC